MDHIKYYRKIKDIPTVDFKELSEKNLVAQRTQFYLNNDRIDQFIKIIISEIKFFKFDKEINKIKLVKIKNEIKKLEKELNKLKKNNKISLALK